MWPEQAPRPLQELSPLLPELGQQGPGPSQEFSPTLPVLSKQASPPSHELLLMDDAKPWQALAPWQDASPTTPPVLP
jgi:hypothetical protein